MGLIETVYKAIGIAETVENPTVSTIEAEIDAAIQNKSLLPVEEMKEDGNKLKIYSTAGHLYAFHTGILRQSLASLKKDNDLLPYGDPQRDFMLDKFAKTEPILAGAVYSMCTKLSSLSWTVIGRKNLSIHFSDVLDSALTLNGTGWGDFATSTAQDFWTLDRGTFWHTPRMGSNLTGRLAELVYMDALACAMTGNMEKPVFYSSAITGQDLWLQPGEYAHFASMVSPREEYFGIGHSSVARAYRSARILFGLSNYDWEKLNNLPPEGVAAVSGLTKDEFEDSLEIWRVARKQNQSLTYPQVLWLLGSQPNTKVGVDFVGFSQIPESFQRKDVVDQYVNVLALVFGVDAREFWPVSTSSMGTAAESEIQHMKARGKGHAELLTIITRYFNSEMPDGVEFAFDTQDVAEDQIAASVAKGWIDAFMPLYSPGKGTPPSKTPAAPTVTLPEGGASQSRTEPSDASGAEPLITKDQFLRLLINRRVLPSWILETDDRKVFTDIGQEEKEAWKEGDPDSPVKIVWKDGKLSLHRQKPINVSISSENGLVGRKPYATAKNVATDGFGALEDVSVTISKDVSPNIKGQPIPERESLRGPRVTAKTIEAELKLWQETPELQAYAPTLDEKELIGKILEAVV